MVNNARAAWTSLYPEGTLPEEGTLTVTNSADSEIAMLTLKKADFIQV